MDTPSWALQPPYQSLDPPDSSPSPSAAAAALRGACHCGRITYRLSRDAPLDSKYCHCRDCQVLHGAPFQWAAIFHKADVAFDRGAVAGLRFYHSPSKCAEHVLPSKVACAHCGSLIMDEGRNMVLLFPTLLRFETKEQRRKFDVKCHIFYPQRVVNIPDGKPKWAGLDQKSELVKED
ncbi:hypothetical protein JDV02_003321 [Purpureocillium takamizusanense]|uniref:CENP-V/GFA domain-containing protein n=1 Tax=Purpureocillium takamizusanense TaxID=2060973 RepID=A0A9Q8V9J6_9HYPO|nr:uncharacterized protein JDV02_003321 [Purpureocillium takamizusanense]UNI16939.1 hypothetical protein JDV02_003321 [Purpureocillium takamizusanense]